MRISRSSIFCVLLLLTSSANAQQVVSLSPLVQKYARVSTPKVRVIDGTGHPPVEDQNVVIERGKIIESAWLCTFSSWSVRDNLRIHYPARVFCLTTTSDDL